MEWGAAIAALLGLILWGLKQWQFNSPERALERQNESTQEVRQAIASGDAPRVNRELDQLLSDVSVSATGTTPDSPERQHSDQDTAASIHDILGS